MADEDMEKSLREARKEWDLEKVRNIYKFDFFFAGLIFAVLSFAIQFPIKSDLVILRIAEACSWVSFIIAGMLALYICGGFLTRHTEPDLKKREDGLELARFWMNLSFVAAMGMLGFVKIASLVQSLPK